MKVLFSLFAGMTLYMVDIHAAVYNPGAYGFASGKEKCASALNSYLLYRHSDQIKDSHKLEKMESQIESMCEGFQIRLVSKDGSLSGIIEAVE